MENKKLNVAVIGAGSIGQIIAGKLAGQNHNVDLIARKDRIESLRALGVRLKNGKEPQENYFVNILLELNKIKSYDAVFLAIRGEQLQDTLLDLDKTGIKASCLILCMPILYPDPKYFLPNFSQICLFFPGFAAKANSNGEIEYFFVRRPSELGPLKGNVSENILTITQILNDAKVKSVAKPNLGFRYTTLSVSGGPFGVAVSKCGYNLVAFSKNKSLQKIARDASIECMDIAQYLTGKRIGFLPKALVYLIGPYLRVFSPLVSKLKKVKFILSHRKKVAKQDNLLLQEIYRLGEQKNIEMPALKQLLYN